MSAARDMRSSEDVVAWHALAADEVFGRLGTDVGKGLDAAEVPRRLEQHGRNVLPEGAERGALRKLLDQFNNVLVSSYSPTSRDPARATHQIPGRNRFVRRAYAS